jgi:hypothetical protein
MFSQHLRMTCLSNGESTEGFDEMLGFLTCHAYVEPVPLKFWIMTNLMHSFLTYLFYTSTCPLDRQGRQSLTRVCYTR